MNRSNGQRANVEKLRNSSAVASASSSKKARFSLTVIFEALSPSFQFSILAGAMFIFFGIHNILQEAMMKVPGFPGVMLGWMEVVGVTTCSFIERTQIAKESGRVAPISAYPLLTLCLVASSSLSNMSLNFINFPTKVVFRSCKLIPTMVIATIINKRVFQSVEYLAAFAISLGLIIFAAVDWQISPIFHPIGLALVSMSVFADAILPNAQERLFRLGSSRLEVTVYTNFFTLITMTITTMFSGDLVKLFQLAKTSDTNLVAYMAIYTCISYIAVSSFMMIVKKYGGVTAVLLSTARKGMTLILSFILFPKAFSYLYVVGAILVLGGLLVASLSKQKKKEELSENSSKGMNEEESKQLLPNNDDIEMCQKQDITN